MLNAVTPVSFQLVFVFFPITEGSTPSAKGWEPQGRADRSWAFPGLYSSLTRFVLGRWMPSSDSGICLRTYRICSLLTQTVTLRRPQPEAGAPGSTMIQ